MKILKEFKTETDLTLYLKEDEDGRFVVEFWNEVDSEKPGINLKARSLEQADAFYELLMSRLIL